MRRALLIALAVACMGDDCDGVKKGAGHVGFACFENDSCVADAMCVTWKNQQHVKQSMCVDPRDAVFGGSAVPSACETCAPCEPGWKRK